MDIYDGFVLGRYTGLFIGKSSNNPPIPEVTVGWLLAEAGKTNYKGIWSDEDKWEDGYVWYD